MKKNMGAVDSLLRILVAVVVIALYFAGVLSGTVAIILLVVAAIFILTGFIGFCPLYLPFGISTRKKK
jgi:K+-transporting ATPase A subunit